MLLTDWNHVFWASNILLANLTQAGAYLESSRQYLQQWICASSARSGKGPTVA